MLRQHFLSASYRFILTFGKHSRVGQFMPLKSFWRGTSFFFSISTFQNISQLSGKKNLLKAQLSFRGKLRKTGKNGPNHHLFKKTFFVKFL